MIWSNRDNSGLKTVALIPPSVLVDNENLCDFRKVDLLFCEGWRSQLLLIC